MKKVHNLFFFTSLIVSVPAFSMDFESMLNTLNNSDTAQREEKGQNHLGISLDKDMVNRYFNECKEGNTASAQQLLNQSNALEMEYATKTNEEGKTGLQIAAENGQFATVQAIYLLHLKREQHDFYEWLKKESSSNKNLNLLSKTIKKLKSKNHSGSKSLSRATSFMKRG